MTRQTLLLIRKRLSNKAQGKIESILNDLWDQTEDNETLKALLEQLLVDLEAGFIGEPS